MDRRDALIESNLGLVHMIARRFIGRGCDYEDLVQIGTMGLIKAIDRFDESKNFQLSTYAVPLIMGEIRQFLRDDGLIKVSRIEKENLKKVNYARITLEAELGREPTVAELADKTGLSVCEIARAEAIPSYTEELQSYSSGNACGALNIATCEEKIVDHIFLSQLISKLSKDELEIIYMRYFLEKTQVQVAKSLGISQASAHRMERKILLRLRSLALT